MYQLAFGGNEPASKGPIWKLRTSMNTGDGGVTVGLGIGNRQLPKHEPMVLSTEKGTGRGASSSFHWISAMPPDRVEWLGRRRSP